MDKIVVFFASLGILGIISIIPLILFALTCMFEYSLWVFTGKEVAWYLDVLGALVLNGINFPLWVFSAIYAACGYSIPIFT